MTQRTLSLLPISWSAHQVVLPFALGELRFHTTYWYPDIDLTDLAARFGAEALERILVHAALFEANKIASLRPAAVDLGPYARYHTEALEALWRQVFHKVWAQWRYENGLPHAPPPPWTSQPQAPSASPLRRDRHAEEVLLFCGGGKDSLASMKLLERAGIPFASFAYAASIYGPAAPQLALIDGLLSQGAARRHHRQIVLDDFFDAPTLALYGEELGVQTITAAETPSSIFAALPLLLAHGYPAAVLGHEASANTGNLIWDATGEDVNHQWGKSVEAEALLDTYVREELIEDCGVFSLLMPLHDVLIFELVRRDEALLSRTHSCNVDKPWCRRCPKCAYVWLSCRGHLSQGPVEATFGEDLLEVPENAAHFRDMVGLGAHTPFECIGQIEESRLALALCQARGLLGPRGRALAAQLPPLDPGPILETFGRVHLEGARLPPRIRAAVAPLMAEAEASARRRIEAALPGGR